VKNGNEIPFLKTQMALGNNNKTDQSCSNDYNQFNYQQLKDKQFLDGLGLNEGSIVTRFNKSKIKNNFARNNMQQINFSLDDIDQDNNTKSDYIAKRKK
jgi:hypothetical protein